MVDDDRMYAGTVTIGTMLASFLQIKLHFLKIRGSTLNVFQGWRSTFQDFLQISKFRKLHS